MRPVSPPSCYLPRAAGKCRKMRSARSPRSLVAHRRGWGESSAGCSAIGYLCRLGSRCPRKSAAIGLFAEVARIPYTQGWLFRESFQIWNFLPAAGRNSAVEALHLCFFAWRTDPSQKSRARRVDSCVRLQPSSISAAGPNLSHQPRSHPGQDVAGPLLAHPSAVAKHRQGL